MTKEENGYKIWWDDDNGIARGIAYGVMTLESANGIEREQNVIIERYGDGKDWLIDLSGVTKAPSKGRKKISELSADPRTGRYAFYGASVFVRTVFNFMMAMAQKQDVRYFRTEEEGLHWLKGGTGRN
jgi:hypothetical protein